VVGPVTLAEGNLGKEEIHTAAAITARYADAAGMESVRIKYESDVSSGILEVHPAPQQQIEEWRI
jgi:hypothetical protein